MSPDKQPANPPQLADLATAVREMRDAQRKYFKHRTKDYLLDARCAECKVDALLRILAAA